MGTLSTYEFAEALRQEAWLAQGLLHLSEVEEAVIVLQRGLQRADTLEDAAWATDQKAALCMGLGSALLKQGRPSEALEAFRKSLRLRSVSL